MDELTQLVTRGSEFHRQGRFAEAERFYREVLQRNPRQPDALHLLGMLAERAGHFEQAVELIRQAIAVQPSNPVYYNNLGTVFESRSRYAEAIACMEEAVRLRPEYAAAHNNLGEVWKARGDVDRALEHFRAALFHDPYFAECRSNQLMVLNYDPRANRQQIFEEHRRWGELKLMMQPPPRRQWPNPRDPGRPLRIGYVSPDFRKHAVARFFEPILRHHDRNKFEVYLYAEIPKLDEVSHRFQALAQGWRLSTAQSTDQVVRRILDDQIDLLVDLAGHTRHNRLDVFAQQAAPLQFTYLGYSNTVGLPTIQYRISDDVLDPSDAPNLTVEHILRLPGSFACFQPPQDSPPISPAPIARNGTITFGSHHPTIKLNDAVLQLWKRVLDAVPNARLLFLRDSFQGEIAQRLRERLASFGYPLERVDVRCPTHQEFSYLRLFEEIDVILDAFPFNSHTMTCEALWMGCPIVTRYGDRPTARLSSSVLSAMGFPDLIARDDEQYIAACVALAHRAEWLVELRPTLRERLLRGVGDGPTFTRHLEGLYRQAWKAWCAGSEGST